MSVEMTEKAKTKKKGFAKPSGISRKKAEPKGTDRHFVPQAAPPEVSEPAPEPQTPAKSSNSNETVRSLFGKPQEPERGSTSHFYRKDYQDRLDLAFRVAKAMGVKVKKYTLIERALEDLFATGEFQELMEYYEEHKALFDGK